MYLQNNSNFVNEINQEKEKEANQIETFLNNETLHFDKIQDVIKVFKSSDKVEIIDVDNLILTFNLKKKK